MSRLFHGGFEMNTLTTGHEWLIANGAPMSLVTSPVNTLNGRGGTYAVRITGYTSGTRHYIRYGPASSTAQRFGRVYFRYATLPGAENTIIASMANDTGLLMIKLQTDGSLKLYDEDGVIGSASSTLSANTWYRIEWTHKSDTAAGTHTIEAKIDGTVFATSSTRDISLQFIQETFGANLQAEADDVGDWYFDDFAVNDTSGANNTGYPGAGVIAALHPNATGDSSQGTPNGAATGWECTDEVAPNDATDYQQISVAADILDVNCEAASVAGIQTGDAVNCVYVPCRTRMNAAGSANYAIRIKSQAGGTTVSSATQTRTNTNWVLAQGLLIQQTDPQAGGAWTPALLDTMQIGFTSPTDATPAMDVSTLAAMVDYLPASPIAIFDHHYRTRKS